MSPHTITGPTEWTQRFPGWWKWGARPLCVSTQPHSQVWTKEVFLHLSPQRASVKQNLKHLLLQNVYSSSSKRSLPEASLSSGPVKKTLGVSYVLDNLIAVIYSSFTHSFCQLSPDPDMPGPVLGTGVQR